MVLSPIYRDINFIIIWFIDDITQILTVRHDLNFAGLDFKLSLEIKEYINFLDIKLFETIAKLCLLN